MNNRLRSFLSVGTIFLFLVYASFCIADTVESQNVVGFFRLNLSSNVYNTISVPMQKLTVAVGQITGITDTKISDSNATWVDGEFAWGVDTSLSGGSYQEPGNSVFYLEISGPTSSVFAGRHVYITNNVGADLTIAGGVPADMLAGISNETYKIVAAQRIRDVFGEPGSPKLKGAANLLLKPDKVLTWLGTGWSTAIWYDSNNNVWKKDGVEVNDWVMDRDEAFFLYREAADTNIVLTGEVSANAQQIALVGPGEYNFIGGGSVVDQFIGDTDLHLVVKGASNLLLKPDKIMEWTGNGWTTAVWWKNTTLEWIQNGTNVNNSYQFKAGNAYFIMREDASTAWTRPSPLQ